MRSLWEMRCLFRRQIQRLHFGGEPAAPNALSTSICVRRLGLLHKNGYLAAARPDTAIGGEHPPYLYTLGPKAVPLLADRLQVPPATIGNSDDEKTSSSPGPSTNTVSQSTMYA